MHGIIHKSLKEYVVENGGESTWDRIREEGGLEPKLYLPVSEYPDEEFDAAVDALAGLSEHDRTVVEREVGRFMAPSLLETFSAYVKADQSAFELLASIDSIAIELDTDDGSGGPPPFAGRRTNGVVTITCRESFDYCSLVQGLLEGILEEFETGGTITELECVRDGDDQCAFRVEPA